MPLAAQEIRTIKIITVTPTWIAEQQPTSAHEADAVALCRAMLARGYYVEWKSSSTSSSIYITVCRREGQRFRVRFADHLNVSRDREQCNAFVGVAHAAVSVEQAVEAAVAALER